MAKFRVILRAEYQCFVEAEDEDDVIDKVPDFPASVEWKDVDYGTELTFEEIEDADDASE